MVVSSYVRALGKIYLEEPKVTQPNPDLLNIDATHLVIGVY